MALLKIHIFIQSMLSKLCPKCNKVIPIDDKYCPKCLEIVQAQRNANRKQSNRVYKANRSDTEEQKFYWSKEWKRVKATVKARDLGVCSLCRAKENRFVNANVVHHITELKEDWNLRLNPNNLICLCNSCHNKVHRTYLIDINKKEIMQNLLRKLIKNEK